MPEVTSTPDDGKVTVTLAGGATRRVPRADAASMAAAGIATLADPFEHVQRGVADTVQPLSEGPIGGGVALLAGGLSGYTGGISDIGLGGAASSAAQDNPGLYTGGQVAGAVIGGIAGVKGGGVGGVGGVAGMTSRLGSGVAARAGGGVRGALVGGAVEGGVAGVGSTISRAAVRDDPVTIESLVADIGVGAFFGAGISGLGAAASKVGRGISARLAAPAQAEAARVAAIEGARDAAKGAAAATKEGIEESAKGARFAADSAADGLAGATREGAEARLAASRQVAEQEAAALRKVTEEAHAAKLTPYEADVIRLRDAADAAQTSAKANNATLRQTQDAASEASRALRAAKLEREAVEQAGTYDAAIKQSIANALDANMERVGVLARAARGDLAAGATEAFPKISAESRRTVKELLAAGDIEGATAAANQWGEMAEAWHTQALKTGKVPDGLGPIPSGGYRVTVETREQFVDRVAKASANHAAAEEAAKAATDAFKAARLEAAESLRQSQASIKQHAAAERGLLLRRGNAEVAIEADVLKGQAAIQKRLAAEEAAVAKELAAAEAALAKAKASSAKGADRAIAKAEVDAEKAAAKADQVAEKAARAYGGVARSKAERPGWLKRTITGAARSGVGRVADSSAGGGFRGAVSRSVASSGTAAVVGTMLGGPVLGAAMAAEAAGVRAAVTSSVARAAARTLPTGGRMLQKASPALARLMMDETGKPGKGTPEEAALEKMQEIANLTVMGPDASFEAIRDLIEASPTVAAGVQKKALEVNAYLAAVMPKNPPTGALIGAPKPRISRRQALTFADQYMAATDPLATIEYLSGGNVNMAMADTLHAVWPAIMKEYTGALVASLPSREKMTHSQMMAYSVILRQPLHSLQSPENIAYFQAEVHGPKSPEPEPKQPTTFTPGAPPARSSTGSAQPAMTQAQRLQNR